MVERRTVTVEGVSYPVVISDESQALLAAAAAGGAVVGIWDGTGQQDLFPAGYALERAEDADDELLEKVVRRHLGLPWTIEETERLWIREFVLEDLKFMRKEEDSLGDEIFEDRDSLEAYIRCQYGFFECGIWALVEKSTGKLVGKAGITVTEDGVAELGYHIFAPFRRQGYGKEACLAILSWAAGHCPGPVRARIDAGNKASVNLAKRLGFRMVGEEDSGEKKRCYLYERNCL